MEEWWQVHVPLLLYTPCKQGCWIIDVGCFLRRESFVSRTCHISSPKFTKFICLKYIPSLLSHYVCPLEVSLNTFLHFFCSCLNGKLKRSDAAPCTPHEQIGQFTQQITPFNAHKCTGEVIYVGSYRRYKWTEHKAEIFYSICNSINSKVQEQEMYHKTSSRYSENVGRSSETRLVCSLSCLDVNPFLWTKLYVQKESLVGYPFHPV